MKLIRIFGRLYGNNYFIIIILYLPILLFAVPAIKGEEVSATRFISKDSGGPLSIASKKMTFTNQNNTILFEGDVLLESNSMVIKAKMVEVVFTPTPGKEQGFVESVDKKKVLSTITAMGDVRFIQGTRTILSDKVIYSKKEEKMIFTGSPIVHQGEDELKGERITVFIQEDRVIVEGGEAILHPR